MTDVEIVREALIDLCNQHGFHAAAAVLRSQQQSYLSVNPDNPGDAAELLDSITEAMRDGLPCVVFERPAISISEALSEVHASTPLQGYA